MNIADIAQFEGVVKPILELYGKTPSTNSLGLWWSALADYRIEQVATALSAHVRDPDRGRFAPTPADIIGRVRAATDHRPGPDEAWAIAVAAMDEAETVVWTAEIAQAWGVARPILKLGDNLGVRMAFQEVYRRLVEESHIRQIDVCWLVSSGADPLRCEHAVHQALNVGRIDADRAKHLLELQEHGDTSDAAPTGEVERLAGKVVELPTPNVSKIRARLAELKRILAAGEPAMAERHNGEVEQRSRKVEGERERQRAESKLRELPSVQAERFVLPGKVTEAA